MAAAKKAFETAVTPREACKIASEAVTAALTQCGFATTGYNYKCISQLDTRALNAIKALGKTRDRTACRYVAVKAVVDFLTIHPHFLEEHVVDYKVKPASMRNSDRVYPGIGISS